MYLANRVSLSGGSVTAGPPPQTLGAAMSPFHLSVSDNMRALVRWHTTNHPLTTWAACPHSPCDHMDPEFRKCWRGE